jgi:hypothetical protein
MESAHHQTAAVLTAVAGVLIEFVTAFFEKVCNQLPRLVALGLLLFGLHQLGLGCFSTDKGFLVRITEFTYSPLSCFKFLGAWLAPPDPRQRMTRADRKRLSLFGLHERRRQIGQLRM